MGPKGPQKPLTIIMQRALVKCTEWVSVKKHALMHFLDARISLYGIASSLQCTLTNFHQVFLTKKNETYFFNLFANFSTIEVKITKVLSFKHNYTFIHYITLTEIWHPEKLKPFDYIHQSQRMYITAAGTDGDIYVICCWWNKITPRNNTPGWQCTSTPWNQESQQLYECY